MTELVDRIDHHIESLMLIRGLAELLEYGGKITEQDFIELKPLGENNNFYRDLLIEIELKTGVPGAKVGERWGLTHARISQLNRGEKK